VVRACVVAPELGLVLPDTGVVVEEELELQAASATPSDVTHRTLATDRLDSFIYYP
jgi:hypothetical protein